MIDLHSHTVFSDGELIPAELTRRAAAKGYTALAITDHGDFSNLDLIIPRLVQTSVSLSEGHGLTVLPGIELTHVPPSQIAEATAKARELGAALVLMHGETIVEPVPPGTNRAAIEARVDILAHPGLITEEDAALAVANEVALEITCRGGHSLSNGHVVKMARKVGATLVINTDTHSPGNLTEWETVRRVAQGAGMESAEIDQCLVNSQALVDRGLRRTGRM